MNNKQKTINTGRHAAECKICAHPSREEIERNFINWRSTAAIAKQYKLANRASSELEQYACDGKLPAWFTDVTEATNAFTECGQLDGANCL